MIGAAGAAGAAAVAFGKGVWALLSAIPWQAWAIAAILAAGWYYGEQRFDSGLDAERARWVAAQVEADRQAATEAAVASSVAETINTETTERGHAATVETRTETAAAVERVRYETRTIVVPAACPVGLPSGVRNEGRAAVERARAAGDPLRAGRDP